MPKTLADLTLTLTYNDFEGATRLFAELGDDIAKQSDHPARSQLEPAHIEDLRTDMAVQPDQTQVFGGEDPSHRFHRIPGCQ